MGNKPDKKEHDSDASTSSDDDINKPLIEERSGARKRRRQNSINLGLKSKSSEQNSGIKDIPELDPDDIRTLQTVAEGEREEYEV